uniref:Uncharacterized protein n=1 Tax=Chromera velia CCMP2878 TaxID=1169474 RepID=A0A0G4F3B2_9ALVE|eukprot:Cvel_15014.t1-p1 / transcript=Cvel_15014.t1 / gene=Cvel_15014 / organism=Chromera_velia_CCMP2878 / gene_product=hypothetical protein / transcript_product=hypothetical protein / location=Cvel_scaffold1092:53671-54126(-) / protein_length=152 / sequence_SO=supercontig / SO=protein_coding / is_pseudo=false
MGPASERLLEFTLQCPGGGVGHLAQIGEVSSGGVFREDGDWERVFKKLEGFFGVREEGVYHFKLLFNCFFGKCTTFCPICSSVSMSAVLDSGDGNWGRTMVTEVGKEAVEVPEEVRIRERLLRAVLPSVPVPARSVGVMEGDEEGVIYDDFE